MRNTLGAFPPFGLLVEAAWRRAHRRCPGARRIKFLSAPRSPEPMAWSEVLSRTTGSFRYDAESPDARNRYS